MLHSRQPEIARLPENGKYISQRITDHISQVLGSMEQNKSIHLATNSAESNVILGSTTAHNMANNHGQPTIQENIKRNKFRRIE